MDEDTREAREGARQDLVGRLTYPDLPIVVRREDLVSALREHQVVVVAGETGSGKSTQLPKLCLEAGLGASGIVGHTQPRRIAARAVAERVAEEVGTEIGDLVGSKVRFADRTGPGTLVKVMTDGVLLAEIAHDRELSAYEAIIIDEAHERSLNIDFLLGYLHQLLPRRPDLTVVITSATIDTARFSAHFRDAPVIQVSGRSYPVDVLYRPIGEEQGDDRDQIGAICDAVDELARVRRGDVLVFLSGERDIREAAEALTRMELPHTEILPLYARLSSAEQHRVFAPHRGRRIVLATNVAETSLTVPGIVGVVDSGTARISRYNRRSKVQRLPIEPVSQASADQRAGRCGRVGPGTCIRLYSEEDYRARPEFTEPEILRTNLASVILQLAALGLGDVESFPFVDPPERRSIRDGLQLLEELGAIVPHSAGTVRLTKPGRRLARLPVDPRLGRMVLEADRHGCVTEVLVIASGLSIQDPRERPVGHEQRSDELHGRFRDPDSDFLSLLALWRYLRGRRRELGSGAFRRLCRDELLHHIRIREWQDLHAQLRQIALGLGLAVKPLATEPDGDAIHRALLAGLPSHVGRWDDERREYRGARETRFSLARGTSLGRRRPRWVVAADLVETDRLRARTVAVVTPQQIEGAAGHVLTRSHGDPRWVPGRGAAVVDERVSLYGLPLVPRRAVTYDRVDPVGARHLFILHALVRGEWEAPHRFLRRNRDVLVQAGALEHRLRRDLLVPEADLVAFFEARVPAEVTTTRRFERWWSREQESTPNLLDWSVEVLTGFAELEEVDARYPEWIEVAGTQLPLTYVANPGTQLDGVTVDLPLLLLDRIDEAHLDWQVPGLREELLTALVRALPKEVRRAIGTAPEAARALLSDVGPDDGPLLDVLPSALSRLAGAPVVIHPALFDRIPDHLRVTFRVVDERGDPVAWSRHLGALRQRMARRQRDALAAASPLAELEGLVDWPGGTLPRTLEVRDGPLRVTGYPALLDEGAKVALRVLLTEADQHRAMWGATRRLLLIRIGSPLRTIDRLLPESTKLSLGACSHFGLADAYRGLAEATVDHLLLHSGGPAWDDEAFAALVGAVRTGFADVAKPAAETVAEAARTATRVEERLAGLLHSSWDETVVDIRRQLGRLLHHGWIVAAGTDRLEDVARYLGAVEHRLDKATGKPERDRARLARVRALERDYDSRAQYDSDGSVRWMLEELRVVTFAEPLGAKGRPSEQKLSRAIAALG